MRSHISGIDHVVVLVHDLDRAQHAYERLGLTLTPRGYHTIGSQNHCIMFGSDYIELLAVPKPHPATQFFSDFLAKGDGLGAVAFATTDAGAAHEELRAAGVEAESPLDFARPVKLAGGERDARFRIVQLPAALTPGCRTFLCQHFTRDVVWRPEYQRHAIGATALAAVAVIVEDPAAAVGGYARLLDRAPQSIDEGLLVATGGAPIAITARWKLGRRLAGVALPLRPRPLVAALFIHVADRASAASVLKRGGYRPMTLADGSIAIGADEAHGVALVFG